MGPVHVRVRTAVKLLRRETPDVIIAAPNLAYRTFSVLLITESW